MISVNEQKEMTALNVPVGAGTEQSSNSISIDSIAEKEENIKNKKKKYNTKKLMLLGEPGKAQFNSKTLTEIYDMTFEYIPPLIEGLLYPGVFIFSGTPKIGKSFLMAQISYHISKGMPLWGHQVNQSEVLYLALEDDFGRIQKRMYRMFGESENDKLHFVVSAGKLGETFNEQLSNFMEEYPNVRLVIIDTLRKILDCDDESYSYAKDYSLVDEIRSIINRKDVCTLIVHHNRKMKSDDIFDMISGTQGLFGSSDGGFVIHKEDRRSKEAKIEVVGRDQAEECITVEKNMDTLCWELVNEETELWSEPAEPVLEEVAKYINADNPNWEGTATELVDILKLDIKPNALSMRLNINAGRLIKEYKILFHAKRTHDGRRIILMYKP